MTRKERLPRLLVATEWPHDAHGGGAAVVRQMLKDYPPDRIYWWSALPSTGIQHGLSPARHFCARIPPKGYPFNILPRLKSWGLDHLWVPWATRHLSRTMEKLRAESLWIIPHLWSIPVLLGALEHRDIPYHLSLHDYPDIRDYLQRFGKSRCADWARHVDTLFSRASTRDVISHPMLEDMRKRTGHTTGQVIHMGLEPSELEALQDVRDTLFRPIRIAYAGSIIVEPEIKLFLNALQFLRKRNGLDLRVEFFGEHQQTGKDWFDPIWMNDNGYLPQKQLFPRLKECSWGFAPMSLTDDDPRYNRFSFPTKFTSYLAAGLPVITLGHPDSSVARLTGVYHVGHHTTTSDPLRLAEELRPVLSDPRPNATYREELLRCARTEFDVGHMRTILWRDLSSQRWPTATSPLDDKEK